MDINEKVRRWIRPSILSSCAYHVPDSSGLIKLDAMENPYTWPDELKRKWLDTIHDLDVNRYPDAAAVSLKEKLHAVFSIPEEAGVILGNGSDELIQIICMAVAGKNTVIMAPEPGFVMYKVVADITDSRFVGVPLSGNDFSLDLCAMKTAIEKAQPAVIFLARPNNPTGNLFDREGIEELIAVSPGIVVIDEAYHAFAGETFMQQLTQYDNLLVMRTLSKIGLAGLRLGFLSGNKSWIDELDKLRMPYNVSVLTQGSVEFALDHVHVLDEQARQICVDRKSMLEELSAFPEIYAWASAANFILFKSLNGSAEQIFRSLKAGGVLIKNLDGVHPLLKDCLRVTVGTRWENTQFLTKLKMISS